MKISEIKFIPVKDVNGLIGFASIVLDNKLYLGSIAVMKRPEGGYRLLFPTKKVGNNHRVSIFHPIDKYFSKKLEENIIDKVSEETK